MLNNGRICSVIIERRNSRDEALVTKGRGRKEKDRLNHVRIFKKGTWVLPRISIQPQPQRAEAAADYALQACAEPRPEAEARRREEPSHPHLTRLRGKTRVCLLIPF